MNVTIEQFAAAIGAVLALLGVGLAFLNYHIKHVLMERGLDKVPEKLGEIEKELKAIGQHLIMMEKKIDGVCWWISRHDPHFIDNLQTMSTAHGNPYDPKKRTELLNKYKDNTITLSEAQELQKIIEEDAEKAQQQGAAIFLLIMLGALAALIAILSAAGKK